jgi:TusA-related sulfurtransferase
MSFSSMNMQIDLGSGMAPVSTLLAIKAFREMQIGETLVIKNCNPETMQMILKCFRESSYELLTEQTRGSVNPSMYQVMIRKTGDL